MRSPDKVQRVAEKTTPKITATLEDTDGTAIPLASVSTLTLKILRKSTQAVIRAEVSILNVNGGTLHATSGALTFQTIVADTTLVDTTVESDSHMVLIRWTYGSGGLQAGDYLIELQIPNTLELA